MLTHLVRRLRRVPSVGRIVLATTVHPADDVLAEFASRAEIDCFRGSEEDVLDRVARAAAQAGAEVVVETTGDCPILDPGIAEQLIQVYLHNECDYVSNNKIPSYPDGMDVRVFSAAALQEAADKADTADEREHVTPYITERPDRFRCLYVPAPADLHWPTLGVTLDEPADYVLLKRIIEHFEGTRPTFNCYDVVELIRSHPDWLENSHVLRRGKS